MKKTDQAKYHLLQQKRIQKFHVILSHLKVSYLKKIT